MTAVLLSCHAHPSPSLKAWNRRPTRPPSSPLAHPKPLLARPFGVSGKAGSENRLKNHSFPHSVQRATPWNPPRQPDCSRHLYSHSSLSFLLPPSWDQSRHWFLSSFNSFFRCSWDDTFSTDPFWLCSRLSFYMVAAEPAITTRRSAHSHSDRSETDSLSAVTVRPTHSQHSITVRPTHSQQDQSQ